MSEYELCKVCGETAYLEQSKNSLMGWKYYCSKVCRYEKSWKIMKYWAYGFFFVASLFLFAGFDGLVGVLVFAIFGILFIKLSYFQRDYALRGDPKSREQRMRNKKERPRRNSLIINRSNGEDALTPIATEVKSGIKYMYSEILDDKVLKCCYQSARLNDKYCVCGRALEYPSQT